MPIFKPDEFLLNILPKKRLLGIDHGTKTLGIAISNSDMTVASPIKTIKRDKLKSDLSKLISIFDEYDITGLVMGWPLNMDGSVGPRCDSVRDFTKKFLDHFDRLDGLINNAAVMNTPKSYTEDGFELQLGTNFLGHFYKD